MNSCTHWQWRHLCGDIFTSSILGAPFFRDEDSFDADGKASLLLGHLLQCLRKCFLYDKGSFLSRERFEILLKPLANQVSWPPSVDGLGETFGASLSGSWSPGDNEASIELACPHNMPLPFCFNTIMALWHAWLYAHTHARMHTRTRTHTHTHAHTRTHTHTHTHTHTCTHTQPAYYMSEFTSRPIFFGEKWFVDCSCTHRRLTTVWGVWSATQKE